HASAPRQPLALLAAHRMLGELATATGRYEEATRYLGEALALADGCAAPYECALTLLALAELRISAGSSAEEARGPLDEARPILAPPRAGRASAGAEALAARLVTARRAVADPAPVALPFGLTAREAEVLRLLAAGLPNEVIGARLFLSPRTVSTHL